MNTELIRGRGVENATREGVGGYLVEFAQPITNCAWNATSIHPGAGLETPMVVTLYVTRYTDTSLWVQSMYDDDLADMNDFMGLRPRQWHPPRLGARVGDDRARGISSGPASACTRGRRSPPAAPGPGDRRIPTMAGVAGTVPDGAFIASDHEAAVALLLDSKIGEAVPRQGDGLEVHVHCNKSLADNLNARLPSHSDGI